jgi:HEAT repeat protein
MSADHSAIHRSLSLNFDTFKGKAMTMALLLFLFNLLLPACRPPEKGGQALQKGKVSIDLQNKQVQHLYELRDQGKIDSLTAYLNNSEATLRYIAAMAFASNRDSTRINELAKLLQDPVEEVRIMAAFALGQIGSPKCEKPLIGAFISGDSLSEHQMFNGIILEAIGKCGSLTSLKNIANISTYEHSDTLLLLGQCRAIYRFMLRAMIDPAATDRMVKMVANDRIPVPARRMAANYLARAEGIEPDSAQMIQIAAGFVRAANQPEIRMALAKALGKTVNSVAFSTLSRDIRTERDWRVRCNMINALAPYSYDTVRAIVSPMIFDTNIHVSHTAARFFIANGQLQDADYYWRIAEKNRNLPVASQIALYHASNRLQKIM